jgi:hypothetical protein
VLEALFQCDLRTNQVEVLGGKRVAKSASAVHAIAKVTRLITLKSSQANKRISH